MPFRLRENLHGCVCDGQVIFLDVEAGRYFSLSRSAGEAFLRLARGETRQGDLDRLGKLVSRGLLLADGGSGTFSLAPAGPPAIRDFLDEPRAPARAPDVLRALAAEVTMAWRLRWQPFADVITAATRALPRAFASGDRDARLPRLVAGAAAASYLLRATDRCLVRALALHSTCSRFGIRTQLVFGVRTGPFLAHCWVQQDDAVLIGDFEQVRLFTPIKVVG